MAKVTNKFVKFMINYVDVLNAVRLSLISLTDTVNAATLDGKTIKQRAAELLTMEEAIVIIRDAAAASGGALDVFVSNTNAVGLSPGVLVPVNGGIGTRKLAVEEIVCSNTSRSWYSVVSQYGALNYETTAPINILSWYDPDRASKLVAYEGGRYHEYPNATTTPLTDVKVASVSTIPIGVSIHYPSTNVPLGFLIEDGRAVSKTEYPELYAVLGGHFGETATTFNLPNKTGLFNVGRSYAGARNTTITAAFNHNHAPSSTITYIRMDQSPHINCRPTGGAGTAVLGHFTANTLTARTFISTVPQPTTQTPTVRTSGTENRPKNIALVSCIKAKY